MKALNILISCSSSFLVEKENSGDYNYAKINKKHKQTPRWECEEKKNFDWKSWSQHRERARKKERRWCAWVGEWWSWQAVPYLETIRDGMFQLLKQTNI